MATELQIHIGAVYALRQRIKPDWQYFHPANGEVRDPRQGAKLKAMGVVPGTPDLVMLSPEGRPHFMEFKRATGAVSAPQQEFMLWAIRANVPHSVVRSVEQALSVFEFWGAVRDPQEDE
jgi:hypothetical protein